MVGCCGIATALALSQSPLATSLHGAALTLNERQLDNFLSMWRNELWHELISNAHGLLCHPEPATARNVTNTFLSAQLIRLYTHPLIIDVDAQL